MSDRRYLLKGWPGMPRCVVRGSPFGLAPHHDVGRDSPTPVILRRPAKPGLEERTTIKILGRLLATVVLLAALGLLLALSAARADPPTPLDDRSASAALEARVEEVVHDLANEPRMKGWPEWRRHEAVEFVTGNMLFIVMHELGHAIISEMELAVLGREEDAADAFSILTSLTIGTDFSHRVLVEAAGGWFLSDLRDKREKVGLPFYDEHGLNAQRAYQIICFLVGSNPKEFAQLAAKAKMPKSRQESCKGDYAVTAWSWDKALKPYLRKPDQPRTPIYVKYDDAPASLSVFERSFRKLKFLESIAWYASEHYAWPKPFTLEMETCNGHADARWTPSQRKVIVCYEIVQDFANLYRGYGNELHPFVPIIRAISDKR
jgi:hypothetical protein